MKCTSEQVTMAYGFSMTVRVSELVGVQWMSTWTSYKWGSDDLFYLPNAKSNNDNNQSSFTSEQ